jgi:hypothetical protein
VTDRELAPHLDALAWLAQHPDQILRELLSGPEEGSELLRLVVRLAAVVEPIIRAWTEPPTVEDFGFQDAGPIVLERFRAN